MGSEEAESLDACMLVHGSLVALPGDNIGKKVGQLALVITWRCWHARLRQLIMRS